jgi:hypothetical protein
MKLGVVGVGRSSAAVAASVTVLGLAFGAASAAATVNTSQIEKPADHTLFVQNLDTHPNQTFKVSGTSDGVLGDAVDINCYQGGASVKSYQGPSGVGVPVASDGSFSVSVPRSTFAGDSCELLAVPHGTTPSLPAGYAGPRVGFSYFQTNRVSSGSNSGDAYDYTFQEATTKSTALLDSIDDCGPGVNPVNGAPEMKAGPPLIYCGGSFYNSPHDFFATNNLDLNRAEIRVDGDNAYGSNSANNLDNGISGFPTLTAQLDSFDPSTGNAKTTESERLVKCTPNDAWNPSPSDCTAYAATGVRINRVTTFTKNGRVQTVSDTYKSTDGKAHSLNLLYEDDLDNASAGWELPGQSSFHHHNTGGKSASSSAPGTVYVIEMIGKKPSLANPVGALTFGSRYRSVRFDNTLWSTYVTGGEQSALFAYTRKVPAGGSVTITWSYATGTSLAEVHRYASAARKKL